jgi:uncharacterized tellurite resistance protein B-like protein
MMHCHNQAVHRRQQGQHLQERLVRLCELVHLAHIQISHLPQAENLHRSSELILIQAMRKDGEHSSKNQREFRRHLAEALEFDSKRREEYFSGVVGLVGELYSSF